MRVLEDVEHEAVEVHGGVAEQEAPRVRVRVRARARARWPGVRTGPSKPTAAHATATRTRPEEKPLQKSRVERVAMAVKSCRPSAWGSVGVRVGVGVRVRVGVRVEVGFG